MECNHVERVWNVCKMCEKVRDQLRWIEYSSTSRPENGYYKHCTKAPSEPSTSFPYILNTPSPHIHFHPHTHLHFPLHSLYSLLSTFPPSLHFHLHLHLLFSPQYFHLYLHSFYIFPLTLDMPTLSQHQCLNYGLCNHSAYSVRKVNVKDCGRSERMWCHCVVLCYVVLREYEMCVKCAGK
jgi:hypothetical protein